MDQAFWLDLAGLMFSSNLYPQGGNVSFVLTSPDLVTSLSAWDLDAIG